MEDTNLEAWDAGKPVSGYLPFMFQVKASLSFCPSISMSRRMGTSVSTWAAFSWITAGS